jgi:hypothetical protein
MDAFKLSAQQARATGFKMCLTRPNEAMLVRSMRKSCWDCEHVFINDPNTHKEHAFIVLEINYSEQCSSSGSKAAARVVVHRNGEFLMDAVAHTDRSKRQVLIRAFNTIRAIVDANSPLHKEITARLGAGFKKSAESTMRRISSESKTRFPEPYAGALREAFLDGARR